MIAIALPMALLLACGGGGGGGSTAAAPTTPTNPNPPGDGGGPNMPTGPQALPTALIADASLNSFLSLANVRNIARNP